MLEKQQFSAQHGYICSSLAYMMSQPTRHVSSCYRPKELEIFICNICTHLALIANKDHTRKSTYKVVTVLNLAQFCERTAPRILNRGTREREMVRIRFGRTDIVTHLTGGQVESRVDMVVLKKRKTSALQKFNPNSPTNRPKVQSLQRLSYPGSQVKDKKNLLKKTEGSMKSVVIERPHISGFRKVNFIPLTLSVGGYFMEYNKQINDYTCKSATAVCPINQKIMRIRIKEAQRFIQAT